MAVHPDSKTRGLSAEFIRIYEVNSISGAGTLVLVGEDVERKLIER